VLPRRVLRAAPLLAAPLLCSAGADQDADAIASGGLQRSGIGSDLPSRWPCVARASARPRVRKFALLRTLAVDGIRRRARAPARWCRSGRGRRSLRICYGVAASALWPPSRWPCAARACARAHVRCSGVSGCWRSPSCAAARWCWSGRRTRHSSCSGHAVASRRRRCPLRGPLYDLGAPRPPTQHRGRAGAEAGLMWMIRAVSPAPVCECPACMSCPCVPVSVSRL